MAEPVLLWLRQDLRLHDQPALIAAAARNDVTLAPPFEPARLAYARALADDDDDTLVRDTRMDPLVKFGLANAFAPEWEKRSRIAWAAIDMAGVLLKPPRCDLARPVRA